MSHPAASTDKRRDRYSNGSSHRLGEVCSKPDRDCRTPEGNRLK